MCNQSHVARLRSFIDKVRVFLDGSEPLSCRLPSITNKSSPNLIKDSVNLIARNRIFLLLEAVTKEGFRIIAETLVRRRTIYDAGAGGKQLLRLVVTPQTRPRAPIIDKFRLSPLCA